MTDAILAVEQMRAAEQAAMAAGTDGWELMQRAGRGAAEWVARIAAGRPVSVLCGPGNNGGDGYVIAETLRRGGLGVEVIAPLAPRTETAQIARDHYAGDVARDAMPRHAPSRDSWPTCSSILPQVTVIKSLSTCPVPSKVTVEPYWGPCPITT